MAAFSRVIANDSGLVRTLVSQYGIGGRIEHFRTIREDLQPHMDRVKQLANGAKPLMGMRYAGSVPRVVINDWLRKQGKNWQQYAVDRDLRAAFLAWFRSRDFSKLNADSYRERPLAINRAKYRHNSILNTWRKENDSQLQAR